jgi:hypothetical protein
MQVFTISQIHKNMEIVHVANSWPIFWKHETWVEVAWKLKTNLVYKLLVNAQVRGFFSMDEDWTFSYFYYDKSYVKVTTWRHYILEAIEVWLAISIEKQINNMVNHIHLELSKLKLCLKFYVFESLNLGNTWNVKLTWLSMVGKCGLLRPFQ